MKPLPLRFSSVDTRSAAVNRTWRADACSVRVQVPSVCLTRVASAPGGAGYVPSGETAVKPHVVPPGASTVAVRFSTLSTIW